MPNGNHFDMMCDHDAEISKLRQRIEKLEKLAKIVREGYDYNPGDSDLDDEQPIHVRMTLGDYRKARRVQP